MNDVMDGRDEVTAFSAVRLRGVSKWFGGLHAVDGVDLEVPRGQRRLVLGPNGAGKSVLFNLIGGQAEVTSGSIELYEQDVTRASPRDRAHCGLARTFQFSSVFPSLTVLENLLVAYTAKRRAGRNPFVRIPSGDIPESVERLGCRWDLTGLFKRPVAQLSYGQQRQIDLVMALVHDPSVLLLDEPAAGLAAAERQDITRMIQSLSPEVTVLLVEHDIEVAFDIADWVTVLHNGIVIAEGEPSDVANRRDVRLAYFGEG